MKLYFLKKKKVKAIQKDTTKHIYNRLTNENRK